MEDIQFNPPGEIVLKMLRGDCCAPPYIAKEHGYSRQNVMNRLNRLAEHVYVFRVHNSLYELVDDPINNPG